MWHNVVVCSLQRGKDLCGIILLPVRYRGGSLATAVQQHRLQSTMGQSGRRRHDKLYPT